jgi:hypothetical protein
MMRAKLKVSFVQDHFNGPDNSKSSETLSMHAVYANSYPADGSDENNTYAKFTPSADLRMSITNPALFGQLAVGQELYLDFTPAK